MYNLNICRFMVLIGWFDLILIYDLISSSQLKPFFPTNCNYLQYYCQTIEGKCKHPYDSNHGECVICVLSHDQQIST